MMAPSSQRDAGDREADRCGHARLDEGIGFLVNTARGRCVDEQALVAALEHKQEPLVPSSPPWAMDNVFITPHTAGETRRYEGNVLDVLIENLDTAFFVMRGTLRNQIV